MDLTRVFKAISDISKVFNLESNTNGRDMEAQKKEAEVDLEQEYDNEENLLDVTKERLEQITQDLLELAESTLTKNQEMTNILLDNLNRYYKHIVLTSPYARIDFNKLIEKFVPVDNGTLVKTTFTCKNAVTVLRGNKSISFELRSNIDKITDRPDFDIFRGKVWPIKFKFNDAITNYNKAVKVKISFDDSDFTILCMPVEVSLKDNTPKTENDSVIDINRSSIIPTVMKTETTPLIDQNEVPSFYTMKPNIPESYSYGKKSTRFARTAMWGTYVIPHRDDVLDFVCNKRVHEDIVTVENNLTTTTILQTFAHTHVDKNIQTAAQEILDNSDGEIYKIPVKKWNEFKKEISNSYKVYNWESIRIEIEPYDGVFSLYEDKPLHFSFEIEFCYKLYLD